MLKRLLYSALAPLLGLAVLMGGFYLLYLAFLQSKALWGVAGGGLVLLGAWLVAKARETRAGAGP